MIPCVIPGRDTIELSHLVCDVNGTLALDGQLLPGVQERFEFLSQNMEIHLVTADTCGKQIEIDAALGRKISHTVVLSAGSEAEQKLEYIQKLGGGSVVAIGQGTNDRLMLKSAALGICVLGPEGAAVESLLNADIVAPDILCALDMLIHPNRLKATLRQ